MNSRFVYGILALVLAAVIAFIAIPSIASKTNGVTEIVRVTEPISKGSQITEDMVETAEVGAHNLPNNIARSLEDVVGKYTTADLEAGDYFLSTKVSYTPLTSDIQLNTIPSGKVAISVTVKTLASGLSDKLQSGDIIRFYHFLDEAVEVPELQFLKVISVTDSKGLNVDNTKLPDPESDEEKQQTATITVLATPAQAQLLTGYENDGALHVALVSRGNEQLADELLLQQDEYLEGNIPEDPLAPTEQDVSSSQPESSGSAAATSDSASSQAAQ